VRQEVVSDEKTEQDPVVDDALDVVLEREGLTKEAGVKKMY